MRKNNLHEKQELPYIIINVQFGCINKYLQGLFLRKKNPTTMIIMMTIEPIIPKYTSAESLLFSLKKQLTC